MYNNEIDILKQFLSFPLYETDGIFKKFLTIPQKSIFRRNDLNQKESFLYVEGKRKNKVLLVAHADTFFDSAYGFKKDFHTLEEKNGIIQRKKGYGLGGDDRAGCAIIWLLKDLGHSILITDGEEHGQKGSLYLKSRYGALYTDIEAKHQFIIQLDRKGSKQFKTYAVGTEEFDAYISKKTSFSKIEGSGQTDIGVLCTKICGVNLSVGYYNEHSKREKLCIQEWLNTYEIVRTMLILKRIPKFMLLSTN